MAHRLQHTRASLEGASHLGPLYLRSTIVRHRAPASIQARTLWWWSRQSDDYSSSYDEKIEERVRRHERILRHRWNKMLRRRAMWEKDITSNPTWPWPMSKRWIAGHVHHDLRASSSTEASRSRVEQQESSSKSADDVSNFHSDFESIKASINKAIEKDTYSALFGQRLQGPTSANNSSWTSLSWIWDPSPVKEDSTNSKQPSPQFTDRSPVSPNAEHPLPNKSPEASSHPIPSAQSVATEEYEYDPISMRKVPRTHNSPPEPTQKSILDTLFSEHGIDIPVKTYKPHKVYGHGVNQFKDTKSSEIPPQQAKENAFESNRKHEFQAMKASTLGNTIDTSPEFFGGVKKPEPSPPLTPSEKWAARCEAPDDDTPLFSGTTFEDRSAELLATRKPRSNWLLDEGFKSAKPDEDIQIPVKKSPSKLQPSLDRTSTEPSSPKVIQPALDRHLGTKGPRATRMVASSIGEKTEDVDLLRPHMVRDNTKGVRTTKYETQQLKEEARSKLETDFATREANKKAEIEIPSWKFSGRLGPVESKHVLKNPDGIVARTLKLVNENLKKNEQSSTKDGFAPNMTATHKFPKMPLKPVTTFTPSTDVLRMDVLNMAVRSSGGEEVRDTYATRMGTDSIPSLTEKLRNTTEIAVLETLGTESPRESAKAENLHPLKTATVKEGIPRYPVFEAHVSSFEPKFARLVDEAKKIRRELREAQLHYKDLKVRIGRVPWSEVDVTPLPSFTMLKEDPTEEDYPQGLDGPFPAPVFKPEPKIQEPVFTPHESSAWNDEQPPPLSELVDFRSQSNPYILLRYSKKFNAVQVVPMTEPPASATSPQDFSRLDNAAKFFTYFPALLREGYEMTSGGHDFVLFRRSKETSRPSIKMEDIVKQTPESMKKSDPVAPRLLKPATSPRMAARLKEEQDLISSFIKIGDVKHTHGLNSFEVHSVLSQLATQVDAGQQEGAKGLKGILYRLKSLRARAITMNATEFGKQVEALTQEVQLARSAQAVAEMTRSRPVASLVREPSEVQKIEVATVLDDIPQPAPGPAAPIAPPSNPVSRPTVNQQPPVKQVPSVKPESTVRQERPPQQEQLTEQEPPKRHQPPSKAGEGPKARVRRQEDGFSGTMKSPPYRPLPPTTSSPSSSALNPPPTTNFVPDPPSSLNSDLPHPPLPIAPRLSVFKRFTRLVKRTILTILGAGVGAYVIGVIAEGIGAEQQQQRVGQQGDKGPRKRVVLPPSTQTGTRPGFYSTESSR